MPPHVPHTDIFTTYFTLVTSTHLHKCMQVFLCYMWMFMLKGIVSRYKR